MRKLASLALGALVLATIASAWLAVSGASRNGPALTDLPPPPDGWFRTLPAGAWAGLPGDAACSSRVHPSLWEPRLDNAVPNRTMPDAAAVRAAFAARPRDTAGGYDPRWDAWLLPRVDGQHTGTTDENIQWAACKWGLSDNLLRAIAFRESDWFQHEVYDDGTCVPLHGCGDPVDPADTASRTYCAGVAPATSGACAGTFSIVGVKAWQSRTWGPMPGNQNGTFPFSRDSTAFALDYLGAFLRGCDEGWIWWLHNLPGHYAPGRLWGCVGVWYAGDLLSPGARHYRTLVDRSVEERPWLTARFADEKLACSPRHGCPHGPG